MRTSGTAGCAAVDHGRPGRAGDVRLRDIVDRAVALDRVVAALAEDHVVATAAGEVVAPAVHGRIGRVHPELRDQVVAPTRMAARIELRRAVVQELALVRGPG